MKEHCPQLGEVIPMDVFANKRLSGSCDASHIPHILACSNSLLEPGQNVKLVLDNQYLEVEPASYEDRDGIVDPFIPLTTRITDHAFWVWLVPGKIKNLTHAFDLNLKPKSKAKTQPEPEEDYNECAACDARREPEPEPEEEDYEDDGCPRGCG